MLAGESVDLELEISDDLEIILSHYISNSSKLLLWLPSERGVSSGVESVASELTELGLDVWIADLHLSYMIPSDSDSIATFPVSDIVKLLLLAEQQGFKEIYFLSAGKGAQLVLDVIYEFSSRFPQSKLLGGSILIHPNIFDALPMIGDKANFVIGSNTSHLPIYMIQAQYSTKYIYTQEIRKQLEKGGSQIFTQLLRNVGSEFYSRPLNQLSGEERAAKLRLPKIIQVATRQLNRTPVGPLPVRTAQKMIKQGNNPVTEAILQPYEGDLEIPLLKLKDIEGNFIDLADYRGKVILVNFWASWCGPCVEEIPSLTRMEAKLSDKPFKILAVNIGESHERVVRFLETVDAGFTVLLDEQGIAVQDWRVYAFPSNFLVDKNGLIQYGYSGALEWDSKEVLEVIETLL